MNPQTVTIISGIVLLLVFALVGSYTRRRWRRRDGERHPSQDGGGHGNQPR